MKEEYKELFISEALDNYEELNKLLTSLEKDPQSLDKIDAVFRITHTLKGNATGMGFSAIAELSHVMEDLFEAIKKDEIELTESIFNDVFKAVDVLGALIDALKTDKTVSYKGIKTKLQVFLRSQLGKSEPVGEIEKTLQKTSETKKESAEEKSEKEIEEPIVEEKNEPTTSDITFSDMVQIPVRKLDNLMNLVGELIIERDRLAAINVMKNGRNNELTRLNRISSDLQYSVMDVRLVQVGFWFNKFHRVVRDAAVIEQKKVQLKLEGTETEIDRNILQIISDSLIHLVRNAVGHGIEKPADRVATGKADEGQIVLSARSESERVIIDIKDDGKGMNAAVIRKKAIEKGLMTQEMSALKSDEEVLHYVFEPGFSSAEQVNEISGRGVGMDVVKRAVDSIGGNVKIQTEAGLGSVITLSLPSSMAVKASLLFELEHIEYAIPLAYTEAVLMVEPVNVFQVGSRYVTNYLGKTIALASLKELLLSEVENSFEKTLRSGGGQKISIVVVSYNNKLVGLVVDRLLQQKEIVEKPLKKPSDKVKSVSGVTILGNGNVCLVLNIPGIMQHVFY